MFYRSSRSLRLVSLFLILKNELVSGITLTISQDMTNGSKDSSKDFHVLPWEVLDMVTADATLPLYHMLNILSRRACGLIVSMEVLRNLFLGVLIVDGREVTMM